MKSVKPFLTFDEQIELLKNRGLVFSNEKQAKLVLQKENYYRFINAYDLEFIDKSTNQYKENTSFELLHEIYKFDRSLRSILFDPLEKIETRFKTALAYIIGKNYGSVGYLNPNIYRSNFNFSDFNTKFSDELSRQKDSPIVKHHSQYYGIPIWAAVEILSFGCVSNIFKYLQLLDKNEIIQQLNIFNSPPPYVFIKWLHHLVIVRNICAHYGRLYNREIGNPQFYLKDRQLQPFLASKKVFPILLVILRLLDDDEANELMNSFYNIILSYNQVPISNIGCPPKWDDIMRKVVDDIL